jgi:flagellar hook-length control protein FliK
MAPGVKETGLMQLLAPPPSKTVYADAPANGDFKAELQRRQSPRRPQEGQSSKSSDRPDDPAKIAAKRSTASKKREHSNTDTDTDVSPEAADAPIRPKPAEPADQTNAAAQEPPVETTPAEPRKKKDPSDAATDPESLIQAAAAPPPVPSIQKAPAQSPTPQAGSANANQQGEPRIVQPLTTAPKEAGQKDQAAAQATSAAAQPDPSSAALAAAAGTSSPPPAAAGSAAQPPQAAGSKKVDAAAAASTPDEALAIQPESGVKANKAAGGQTHGQETAEGDQGSAQGDAAEIHLAAQSLDDEAASHKIKSDDGSDAAFSHLLDAAGPKPTSAPSPAAAPAPAPALRPEAQFAETNHPTIISSIRGQLLPGGGSMHLRLDPPELGAMQVTVQMHNGVMTASFETSSDEATRALSHSLNQLKTALESQGVQVDKLQVRQQTTQESRHQGEGSQQQQQQAQDNPARQQQRRDLMRRMWAKLALGDEPLDITG